MLKKLVCAAVVLLLGFSTSAYSYPNTPELQNYLSKAVKSELKASVRPLLAEQCRLNKLPVPKHILANVHLEMDKSSCITFLFFSSDVPPKAARKAAGLVAGKILVNMNKYGIPFDQIEKSEYVITVMSFNMAHNTITPYEGVAVQMKNGMPYPATLATDFVESIALAPDQRAALGGMYQALKSGRSVE